MSIKTTISISEVKTLTDFTRLSSADQKKIMQKVVRSANEMQRKVMDNSAARQ